MKILSGLIALLILTGCSVTNYNREEWGDWTTRGGCSTREIVLKRDGVDVKTGKNCTIISGRWLSQYDQQYFTDPADLEIDHIVPLKEAFLSGAENWSKEQKNKFYNSLTNLIAVSGKSNGEKSDQDPAHWLPNKKFECAYVLKYAAVKNEFSLTMDKKELTAVDNIRNSCVK